MKNLPFPKSLLEFQKLFPDDAACAKYLESVRWPDADHRVRITQDERGRHVVTGCGPLRIWDSFDRAVDDAAARIPAAEAHAAIINSLLPEVP